MSKSDCYLARSQKMNRVSKMGSKIIKNDVQKMTLFSIAHRHRFHVQKMITFAHQNHQKWHRFHDQKKWYPKNCNACSKMIKTMFKKWQKMVSKSWQKSCTPKMSKNVQKKGCFFFRPKTRIFDSIFKGIFWSKKCQKSGGCKSTQKLVLQKGGFSILALSVQSYSVYIYIVMGVHTTYPPPRP
jgi:hypothetical protein